MNTQPFGTDGTFDELCERIRGFSHDDASPAEKIKLSNALQMLAEETVQRYTRVRKLEQDLKQRLTETELRESMQQVIHTFYPPCNKLTLKERLLGWIYG